MYSDGGFATNVRAFFTLYFIYILDNLLIKLIVAVDYVFKNCVKAVAITDDLA